MPAATSSSSSAAASLTIWDVAVLICANRSRFRAGGRVRPRVPEVLLRVDVFLAARAMTLPSPGCVEDTSGERNCPALCVLAMLEQWCGGIEHRLRRPDPNAG